MYHREVVFVVCLVTLYALVHGCRKDGDITVDVVFVVDGSGSIEPGNFESVKRWLSNAVSIMYLKFGNRAQFGMLEYSNYDNKNPIAKSRAFDIPFRLGDCDNLNCMKSRIANMKYLQGSTYTYYGLRRAIEVEFPNSKNYPYAKKVMILLTDGFADDGELLYKSYNAAVEEDITTFAIGVGNFNRQQLTVVANGGKNYDRVYTAKDFESINSVINAMVKELKLLGFFCDECRAGTDDCSPYADCIDLEVGYECHCIPGYYGSGKDCVRANYCSLDPCTSIVNSYCVSESNGPSCICYEGYELVGNSCVDIDQCRSNPCAGENRICIDTQDGYFCTCDTGYWWDGFSCEAATEQEIDLLMIVTMGLAILLIIVIIAVSMYLIRRQHSYTIGRDTE